jgi:hypothetical protein
VYTENVYRDCGQLRGQPIANFHVHEKLRTVHFAELEQPVRERLDRAGSRRQLTRAEPTDDLA